MGLLTKESLAQTAERRYTEVPILGCGTARFQSLTASEMRDFENFFNDRKGDPIMGRVRRIKEVLVARSLVDGQGKRVFTDEDALNGMEMDGAARSKLYAEAKAWTGYGADPDFAAIEDAAKNSGNTNSNGSASESPKTEASQA